MMVEIVMWHGEHRTLFYIVDSATCDVIVTCHSRAYAEALRDILNKGG